MEIKHGVTVCEAYEALRDPARVVIQSERPSVLQREQPRNRAGGAVMGNKTIEEILAEEAEAAELAEVEVDDHAPLPANVAVTRGHSRSKVLQIRLNGDEMEHLELLAKTRGLPTSTVARSLLLDVLMPSSDAKALLTNIELSLA